MYGSVNNKRAHVLGSRVNAQNKRSLEETSVTATIQQKQMQKYTASEAEIDYRQKRKIWNKRYNFSKIGMKVNISECPAMEYINALEPFVRAIEEGGTFAPGKLVNDWCNAIKYPIPTFAEGLGFNPLQMGGRPKDNPFSQLATPTVIMRHTVGDFAWNAVAKQEVSYKHTVEKLQNCYGTYLVVTYYCNTDAPEAPETPVVRSQARKEKGEKEEYERLKAKYEKPSPEGKYEILYDRIDELETTVELMNVEIKKLKKRLQNIELNPGPMNDYVPNYGHAFSSDRTSAGCARFNRFLEEDRYPKESPVQGTVKIVPLSTIPKLKPKSWADMALDNESSSDFDEWVEKFEEEWDCEEDPVELKEFGVSESVGNDDNLEKIKVYSAQAEMLREMFIDLVQSGMEDVIEMMCIHPSVRKVYLDWASPPEQEIPCYEGLSHEERYRLNVCPIESARMLYLLKKLKLVGIELNPGPGGGGKSKKEVVEVKVSTPGAAAARRKARRANNKPVVVLAKGSQGGRPIKEWNKQVVAEALTPERRIQKQAFMVKSGAIKKMNNKVKKKFNNYLATLIDPENHGGVRVPDGYDRATGVVQGIIEFLPYYFPGDDNVETRGSFYIVQRPSVVHPIWEWRWSTAPSGPMTIIIDDQNERFGLFPLSGTLSPTEQSDQLIMQTGVKYNVRGPASWRNLDYIFDPFVGKSTDASQFFGYPLSGIPTAATCQVTVVMMVDGNSIALNDTVDLYVVKQSGETLIGTVTCTAAQTRIAFGSIDISAQLTTTTSTAYPANKAIGRPGLGFRLKYTSIGTNNGTMQVQSISILPFASGGTYTAQQLCMVPQDLPDLNLYVTEWTRFRTVSMCLWLQYQGSDLLNGGSTAGALYQGGQHPNLVPLWNHDYIAQLSTPKRVWEGKVCTGNYLFWMPLSTEDTKMRTIVGPGEFNYPYFVVAGSLADTTQITPLRLRSAFNYEFVSNAQIWNYRMPYENQAQMKHAYSILKGAKLSMENPIHMKVIAEYLKKAMGMASDFGGWLNANKSWLMPAATTALTLL